MILNVGNSTIVRKLAGGGVYLDEYAGTNITIFVDHNVKNRGKIVDGLRVSPVPPVMEKAWLTKDNANMWNNAIQSFKSMGNLNAVLEHVQLTQENANLIMSEANNV